MQTKAGMQASLFAVVRCPWLACAVGWVALASLRKGDNPFRDQEGRRISSPKRQPNSGILEFDQVLSRPKPDTSEFGREVGSKPTLGTMGTAQGCR